MELTWTASPTLDELAPALVAAIAAMPSIAKSSKAEIPTKAGGKYSYAYAGLAEHLDAIRPVLAAHGLAVLQPTSNTEQGVPIVSTVVMHVSGQYISSTLAMKPSNADAQSVGSAITYARRYALAATLSIATEDDDGAHASRPALPERPEFLTGIQVSRFRSTALDNGVDDEAIGDIVRVATQGRTSNPNMVHAGEYNALRDAYKAASKFRFH